MNKTDNQLASLKVNFSNLEETAEGSLRGGFAVVGGEGGISPQDINYDCVNDGCNNGPCGHSNARRCANIGCNNGCPTSPAPKGNSMSIGMTFAF